MNYYLENFRHYLVQCICLLTILFFTSSCEYEEVYTYTIKNESSNPIVVTIDKAYVNSGETSLVVDTIAVSATREVFEHYGGVTSKEAHPPRYEEFYYFTGFKVQMVDSTFTKTDLMVESNWRYYTQPKNRKGVYSYIIKDQDF